VIVVGAISSFEDVKAVRSIIQRGVAVVGAAEATSMSKLLNNSELNALVGRVQCGDAVNKARCN